MVIQQDSNQIISPPFYTEKVNLIRGLINILISKIKCYEAVSWVFNLFFGTKSYKIFSETSATMIKVTAWCNVY